VNGLTIDTKGIAVDLLSRLQKQENFTGALPLRLDDKFGKTIN